MIASTRDAGNRCSFSGVIATRDDGLQASNSGVIVKRKPTGSLYSVSVVIATKRDDGSGLLFRW